MNLVDYGTIIMRRGWMIVLLAMIAAGAAFLFSRQLEPAYRATQKVLIVPSRSDFGLTQAAIQILNNHVAYLDSSLRAAEIIDDLGSASRRIVIFFAGGHHRQPPKRHKQGQQHDTH